MCGFVGGTGKEWNYRKGIDSLFHRGPDSSRLLPDEFCTLGFSRLAIIDLSDEASQPMISEDGKVRIVFNGEIYAYKEITELLKSKGYKFRTKSDTEVLLTAYIEWGDNFVNHIEGMFAIAIYDMRSKKIKLYRDRPGIKPLYYYYNGVDLAFASELKGILSMCENISFQYDYTALYDYLTYLYIPAPKTLYKNVYKLLPAQRIVFDLDSNTMESKSFYWNINLNFGVNPAKIEDACECLRALVADSVKNQLVADVPVGFFLSGGLDSSVVVAEASKFSNRLEAFSIGFDQIEHTETNYAAEVANCFQVNHYIKNLSLERTNQFFSNMKIWFDEPYADTSAFPTFLVSKFAREKVTVALTGDGGDEVLGGYRWYKVFERLNDFSLPRNPSLSNFFSYTKSKSKKGTLLYRIANKLELITNDDVACYAALLGGMTTKEKEAYAKKWEIPRDYDSYWYFRRFYLKDLPLLTRLQFLDFHTYLPDDILTKVDRVSMAVSLEARVPLLDTRIISYLFSIPEEIRYFNGQLKGLLKEAYKGLLPDTIINREKKGFSIPPQYLNNFGCRKQEIILKEVFLM